MSHDNVSTSAMPPALTDFLASGRDWRDSSGGSLFVIDRGPKTDEATPLLFLHGIPTWSFLWREVIAVTSSTNRSVAIDLPGFGLSTIPDGSPMTVESMADRIEEFVSMSFHGDRGPALVAHDFGALVASELLFRSPGRFSALILLNTSLVASSWIGVGPLSILRVPGIGEIAMSASRRWMLRLAMYPFVAERWRLIPNVMAGYWLPFQRGFGRSLLQLFRERAMNDEDFARWRTTLATYPIRSMLVWGVRDPTFGARQLNDLIELIPSANVIRMTGASHFVPIDRPRAVGRAIRAFADRLL